MKALLVIAVLAAPAHADLEAKGVYGAATIAGLGVKDEVDGAGMGFTTQPGWSLGASLRWRLSPTFSFQLEGAIANKRFGLEVCSPCVGLADISLWYLEIPALFRFHLNETLHLDVGPVAVLALGGGRHDAMTGEYQRFADLLPINFGAVVGLGVEVAAGPGKLTFDARYQRWALDATGSLGDGSPPPGLSDGTSVVRVGHQFFLVAGYAFP